MEKKFRRSDNTLIAGVCGGIGEYFDIDILVIRILFATISLFFNILVVVYIILALVLPDKRGKTILDNFKSTNSNTTTNNYSKEFYEDIKVDINVEEEINKDKNIETDILVVNSFENNKPTKSKDPFEM